MPLGPGRGYGVHFPHPGPSGIPVASSLPRTLDGSFPWRHEPMTRKLTSSGAGRDRLRIVTCLALALAGTLALAFSSPQFFGAVGAISSDSVVAWTTIIGIGLAIPIVVAFLAATVLSLIGLVRGPRVHRIHLLIWWIASVGGIVLSEAMRSGVPLNPYLGTLQPAFELSDALLLGCLGLSIAVPCTWAWRTARGYYMN
jgi:hypothetical protein